MATFTACTQCKHFLATEPNPHIWYSHYCEASPLPMKRDPYDGAMKPYTTNDLGGRAFAMEKSYGKTPPFKHCRDVNTEGECSKYAAMEL